MKIFFRYLFIRLFIPFVITFLACAVIWIMIDLYGNIDDFLEHKINLLLILRYYSAQIPIMLVLVLPATLLFSTLATLLGLNRRNELVAFQSGGMAPIWLFSPFFLFACVLVIVMAIDMSGPAAQAKVMRDRLLKQVKGENKGLENLPYVDNGNRRIWYFQSLDANQGKALRVEIELRDAQGHDLEKYFAREANWNGEFWKLTGVKKVVYGVNGIVQDQKIYEQIDLPDVTTPPKQLSLIVSQPEQLTVPQLSQYIATSTTSRENLAKYRTEWWYRILYPFSLIVLMLYALLYGTHTDRRSATAGVMWSIVVLFFYIVFINIFMAFGQHDRLPPFVAVIITPLIFGGVGLHLLAVRNGWWWQLVEVWKRWRLEWAEEEAGGPG